MAMTAVQALQRQREATGAALEKAEARCVMRKRTVSIFGEHCVCVNRMRISRRRRRRSMFCIQRRLKESHYFCSVRATQVLIQQRPTALVQFLFEDTPQFQFYL
jgi:hypothetical protein